MSELFRKRLPIELTNGNDGRQKTWYLPASRRKKYESILLTMRLRRDPFPVPVVVTVVRILGKGQKFWDSSSGLRGNYKEIEDALVAVGWFREDSFEWIKETRFRQDGTRRGEGAGVEIIVEDLPLPG